MMNVYMFIFCCFVYFILLFNHLMLYFFFFFFQAEDGIRDLTVTGVQTCALPISARPGALDRPRRGRKSRPRASRSAHERRAAPRGARSRGSDGTAGGHRAARRPRGAPLAGDARVTAPAASYAKALDLITRVRGVRGAMLVSAEDGIIVAEQLMEGIKGPAVSALAASLATRLRRAMEAGGGGPRPVLALQARAGATLVVPNPAGTPVVP